MSIRLPGKLAEAFEACGILGKGAFGTVVEARDRALDRAVAIKVLSVSDGEAAARFLREAEALARLSHPHIVKVFDYGVEEGVPYLVMELLTGRSLDFVEPARDPVDVMLDVASALEEVHAQGVIHRDLKPANIVVDEDGRPVLTDFGLAFDASRTELTRTGQVLGTPSYMSPETLCGMTVEPAADWYAWGVTLYTLLEGSPPWTADEVIEIAAAGTARSVRFRKLDPESPEGRVIRRCLGPPEQRPGSRAALLALLDRGGLTEQVSGEVTRAEPAVSLSLEGVAAVEPEEPVSFGRRAGLVWGLLGLLALGWWGAGGEETAQVMAPEPVAAPTRKAEPPGLNLLGANDQGYGRYLNKKDGSVMIRIPGGKVVSHANRGDEPGPEREVELRDFLMDRYEVTQGRYLRFLDATGTAPPSLWKIHAFEADKPVVGVSWDDAVAYCAWAGGRLPTIEEWEHAARGDDGREFPWGDEAPDPSRANYKRPESASILVPVGATTKVGTYPAGLSPYGIHNMAGNVAEWIGGERPDGVPLGNDRLSMGSSWSTVPERLSVWNYRTWPRDTRDPEQGFRMVRDLEDD